jgi:energy-coupling factor transport system permease protein
MFHTLAWVAWLVAAAVPAFTLRNPLYLALILGASGIVYLQLGRSTPTGRSWGAFVRIGILLLAVSVLFNALTSHYGAHVLLRLPAGWPILGGPVTVEGVVAGAVNGLSLLAILMVLATFNAVVDHYQLLRLTPAFMFQAGMVASIAITFVPQMVVSAAEIRQAQRIRGHRFRGIRDLLPLIMPLLATALEKAIQLAETMEARGFGSTVLPASRSETLLTRAGLLAALLALLAGLFLLIYVPGSRLLGWTLVASALCGMAAMFWLQGRHVRRSWYRRTRWTVRDTVVVVASGLALGAVVAGRLANPAAIVYNPYAGSLLPPFNPLVGAGLVLLAVPAVLAPGTLPDQELTHDPV